jgi:two-component system, LytTR family, sensor histidine kinase AlgZ
MHPILAERRRLGFYLGAWAPLGGLLALLLHFSAGAPWPPALALALPAALVHAFICLAAWYPVRSLSAGPAHWERSAMTHASGALVSTTALLAIVLLWTGLLEKAQILPGMIEQFRKGLPILAGFGLLLYLLAVSYHHLMVASDANRRAERRLLELDLLSREAELKLLRAQISPHFLFNALNSVAALTHADPEAARAMCLRLAEFLRAGLRLGAKERIPLREELAMTESFLAVERARFGERLRVEQSVAPACLECLVPPLILQPLVENAVRYGVTPHLEGSDVLLFGELDGGRLRLRVENRDDAAAAPSGGQGLGLENVRQRLERTYGSRAGLRVSREGGRFRVELDLPAAGGAAP